MRLLWSTGILIANETKTQYALIKYWLCLLEKFMQEVQTEIDKTYNIFHSRQVQHAFHFAIFYFFIDFIDKEREIITKYLRSFCGFQHFYNAMALFDSVSLEYLFLSFDLNWNPFEFSLRRSMHLQSYSPFCLSDLWWTITGGYRQRETIHVLRQKQMKPFQLWWIPTKPKVFTKDIQFIVFCFAGLFVP